MIPNSPHMSDTPQNDKVLTSPKVLAQVITLVALSIALTHLLWPKLAIDAITIAFVAIAVLPWLAPIFKSIELPGIGKVEFKDMQKAANRAEQAGILAPPTNIRVTQHSSHPVMPYSDPNLALAALRIDIEKHVRLLAQKHNLPIRNLSKMLYDLTDHKVLDKDAYYALRDMIKVLNHAVHGGRVEPDTAQFTTSVGPRLLEYLANLADQPSNRPSP